MTESLRTVRIGTGRRTGCAMWRRGDLRIAKNSHVRAARADQCQYWFDHFVIVAVADQPADQHFFSTWYGVKFGLPSLMRFISRNSSSRTRQWVRPAAAPSR